MPAHAIVIGAGIGGLCTAIALKQIGLRVSIFEQALTIKAVGGGITLWPNALAVLDRLGLHNISQKGRLQNLTGGIRIPKGAWLTSMSKVAPEIIGNFTVLFIHRTDLQQALMEEIAASDIHLGARCTGVRSHNDRVTACFADGSETAADFLVGADGLNSIVRACIHGQQPPVYAGYTSWRGVAQLAQLPATGETWGRGKRFGIVPLRGNSVYWFATCNAPEGSRSAIGEKPHLLKLFRGWHTPIEDLIQATPPKAILRHDIYDRPSIIRWGRGAVTLLGDAAHPMTPNMGQGACQAMEDALALAECLQATTKTTTIPEALRNYEKRRAGKTAWYMRRSRTLGRIAQLENPWATLIRNLVIKFTPANLQARRLATSMYIDNHQPIKY